MTDQYEARREATPAERQENLRNLLSQKEDEIHELVRLIGKDMEGEGQRWLAIGRTDIQKGFMCIKRGLYEGKRVGD